MKRTRPRWAREPEAQFIVGGRHVAVSRIGREAVRTTYCSHMLHHVGYQLQCVITHTGHCVHVTSGDRAATHDMTVCKNSRRELLAGLLQMAGTQPTVMGDKGYVSSGCPELINARNPVLDKHRLLIEAYFGRMASVFGIVSAAFPRSHQYLSDYIRAVCFLTNVSVYLQRPRDRDAEYHSAMELMWRRKAGDRRETQGVCEDGQRGRGTSCRAWSPK